MLRFDRIVESQGRVHDLATGSPVSVRRLVAQPALFQRERRRTLIDWIDDARGRLGVWERWRPPELRRSALQVADDVEAAIVDAPYGTPRVFELPAMGRVEYEAAIRVSARRARRAGWIPIGLAVLLRLGETVRRRSLPGRSLVVYAREEDDDVRIGTQVLAELGSRQPHLILRWHERGAEGARRRDEPRLAVVREAMAYYGVPDDRDDPSPATGEVESRARWALIAAELTGSPVAQRESCGVRLAAILAERDGRFEARALLERCASTARRAVRATRDRIEARLSDLDRRDAADAIGRLIAPADGHGGVAMVDDFVGVLQLCQDTEDEHLALSRVGAFVRERLQAATVAFIAPEGGDLRVIAKAGADAPAMEAARRSIESGCAVPAAADRGPAESASPVRHAAEIIGAVWCRWSAGTPISGADARTLLGVVAAASAPSMRVVVERHRPRATVPDAVPELVGESAAIRTVRAAVLRAAASPFPVLIEGESGSGKELVARAIHACGPRRERRFCAINCAALVDDLVEAELFGHARGAFTGATTERAGLFEDASGGTLFLDEAAELGGRVQAKLLRTLQEGEVRRIGESTIRKVDVRIVAATNRPLADEVAAGRFRRDLWYRLDVIRIGIPPLRERIEDLPLLVRHLWSGLSDRTGSRATLSAGAVSVLAAYDWPGNVRELQNVLASALVAAPRRGVLGPSAWPAHVARVAALAPASTLDAARRQFEARYVRAAMARAGGRTSVAARELGLSRQGLSKLLARLGIGPSGPSIRHVE